MPNIGIAERQSMTFLVPDDAADKNLKTVESIFDDLGQTMVTDESLLTAGNALAGCGIAFIMRYVRAASEAGVELGLKADTAKNIVLQTMKGAVALLEESGSNPEAEIDKVTTLGRTDHQGSEHYGEERLLQRRHRRNKGCKKIVSTSVLRTNPSTN